MQTAQRLALQADRLRDIAAGGLRYTTNSHDRECYAAVQQIAMELLALSTDEALDSLEPLRASIFSRMTPLVIGDAAIIDYTGEILLVQRHADRTWALPGGALAVGETPAEGVIREAEEETGVPCAPVALAGIFDSRLCGMAARHHLYVFTFLCKPTGERTPRPPLHETEIRDARWFSESALPRDLHAGSSMRLRQAFRAYHGDRLTHCDGLTGS